MIWQCIIVTSFASESEQTIHGVVRDNRFSIVRETEIVVVFRVLGPCTCDV